LLVALFKPLLLLVAVAVVLRKVFLRLEVVQGGT